MKPVQRYFAGLALLLVTCSWLSGACAAEWEVLKDTGKLRVERRPYQGSPLDELRGVILVHATLNSVMALLRDAPYNQHWVYRSGGARILRQEGYARSWVYGIVDAPPPLRDRDSVVRFDFQQDVQSKAILVTFSNVPGFIPENRGYVRVPDFGGFWKLEPRDGGRVEVTYQVRGSPGGWVPVWLANYAAEISVLRTLQNMPLALERYEGGHTPEVQERPGD
jgi:hypothetical protein